MLFKISVHGKKRKILMVEAMNPIVALEQAAIRNWSSKVIEIEHVVGGDTKIMPKQVATDCNSGG